MAARDKMLMERVIHLSLSYQLDIWARDKEDALGLLCETLFYINDKPAIKVQVERQLNPVDNYLEVTEVIDNSDVSMEMTRGRLCRQTIMLRTLANIYKFEESKPFQVEVQLYSYEDLFKKD